MRAVLFLLTFSLLSCVTQTNGLKPKEKVLKEGQLPLELFFRNPVAKDVVISPDGKKLAALQPLKGRMNVFVRDVGQIEWRALTKIEDRDIASLQWKDNETLLFSKDEGGDENFHLYAVKDSNGELRNLTPFQKTKMQLIDDLDGISSTDVIVGLNNRDPKVFDVYRINVKTGDRKLILQNPGNFTSFIIDNKGALRVAMGKDGATSTYFYRTDENKPFQQILKLNFKDQIQPYSFDKKNKNIYATSNLGRNTSAVVEWNPQTGKVLKTLYTNADYDVGRVFYSRQRQELVSASYEDWKVRRHFFSDYFKNAFLDLEKQIKDRDLSLVSANDKQDLWVVSAASDRSGLHYYLYEVKSKKLTFLLNSTPWLKEELLVSMTPIEYTSRDGLKIQAYLFLPNGLEAKNLPVVINPHGGPWARDSWGFRPEAQFLANRGYAVLKMNFRGSTGFGKKFWEASFKQWGLKMQDDVTDGVAWLVQKEIADKERIAIYGASYGGYATLAGLAFTPDLYRCGVDYVGVSNIFTLLETVPPYWLPMREMMYEMIGDPVKDKELLTKVSPVFHADKIVTPLFVAQGAQDPRVKKSESDQIVEALKKRGVDVPYLVKDNEGHGFRNEENRFEFYRQMEAFLDRHMQKR
jgi:dipeptidyl aminopeptidase/acylaminoacyl peptidase